MKKILICFTLAILLLPNIGYAEHALTGMATKEAKKNYNDLSETEKAEVESLKKQLKEIWEEYAKKAGDYAEKDLRERITTTEQQDGVLQGAFEGSAKKGLEKYESEYFGAKDKPGDGKFGEIAMKLFDYGINAHVDRNDNGIFDSCSDSPIIGDGICEGVPKAFSSVKYDLKAKKFSYTLGSLTYDFAKGPSGNTEAKGKNIAIASPGMFTQTDIREFGKCKVGDEKKKIQDQLAKPKIKKDDAKNDGTTKPLINLDGMKDKVGEEMTETFKKFTNHFNEYLFAVNCDGDSLSIIGQFLNISRPLNITDNQYIMRLVYITQQIAFTMSIVIIAFFALMYTTGFQNMDPVKFGIRLFFCILAVTYLPWLMQDVLNLNNTVVYNVSSLEFAGGNTTEIIMGAFSALWESIAGNEGILSSLLLLILVFIMAVLAIVPMLRVVMWWYIRLLRIFLGAIVGPILVMLAALPQTENTAKAWITKFVGQVFEQVFMAFALVMIALIVGNIKGFGETIGIGWFGQAMLIYSAIYFLAEVPSFAGDFLSSFSGGSDAKMAAGVYGVGKKYGGKAVGGAKSATVGAAAMGYGIQRGLRGKGGVGDNEKGLSAYVGRKMLGNKAGKFGLGAGQTANQGGKNLKEGFKAGVNGEGTKDAKGLLGTAGVLAGAGTVAATKGAGAATRGAKKAGQKVAEAAKNKMNSTMEDAYKKSGSVPFNSDFKQAFNDTLGGGNDGNGDSSKPKMTVFDQDENGNWVDGNGEKMNGRFKDKWTVGGESESGTNGSFKYGSSSPLQHGKQRKGSGESRNGENKGGGTPHLTGPQFNAPKLEHTPELNKKSDGGGGDGGKGNNPPPHNPTPNSGGQKPPKGPSGKDDGDNSPNPPSPMNPIQYSGTFGDEGGGDYSNYKSSDVLDSIDSFEIFGDDSSGDSHGGGTPYHRSSKEDRGSVDDDAGDSHIPFSPVQYGGSSHTEDFSESHSTYTRASDSDDSDSTPYHQSRSKERSSVDREETDSHSTTPSNPLRHSGSDYSGTTTGTYTGSDGREETIEVEIYEPSPIERTSPRTTETDSSYPDTPSATFVNGKGETEIVEVEIVEEPKYSQKFDRSSRKTSGNSSQVRPTPRTKPSTPSGNNKKGKTNKKDDPNDKKKR